MNDQDITVEDFILNDCSISLFSQLARDNDYWKKPYDFWYKNKYKKYRFMSFRQKMWLIKIKDQLKNK